MYSFKNDYSEGAHPRVLEALGTCNFEQAEGYGLDLHTQAAVAVLKEKLQNDEAQIHFPAIRLVTSWATDEAAVDAFATALNAGASR